MTKHFVTNLAFVAAVLLLLCLHSQHSFSGWWYILVLGIYFAVIGLGSYFIELNFFTYSYCQGSKVKPCISITFDDGPNTCTEEILNILKVQKATATFFLIGSNIKGREDVLSNINAEGHTIGTHSYYHKWWFPLQLTSKITAEIETTQQAIKEIIHKKPLLFRPPFGVTDPRIAKAIKSTRVKSIGWSVRSMDTVIDSSDKLLAGLSTIKNGDIILFHDAGKQTRAVLPPFINYVRSQGFEIIPLPELLGLKAYEV